MPHKTINSFPSLKEELDLPMFLRAVGCSENLNVIERAEGYIYHQIFVVESGELRIKVNDESYSVGPGEGFFIRRDVPYCFKKTTPECISYWVSFGCNFEDVFFEKLKLGDFFVFSGIDVEDIKMRNKRMYLLSTEDEFRCRLQNSAAVYDLVAELYSNEKKREETDEGNMNPSLLLAKRYIEQYYFDDLTLEDIADYAHVSPQHLCRLFKKYLNMRPTYYINYTRIKVAKWSLHGTDKSIAEISEEVGFSSPYYFTNTFKKYENMSPSAYRKMVKGT